MAGSLALRTFGLSQLSFSTGEVAERVIGILCQGVTRLWLGERLDDEREDCPTRDRTSFDPDSLVSELVQRLGLTTEQLETIYRQIATEVRDLMHTLRGKDAP